MKRYLFVGLLVLLVLGTACSTQKDDATNVLTGRIVADLGNEQVKEKGTTISVVQNEENIVTIEVLGKNGLEPKEVKTKLGDKIRFYNKDPANKDMEITMRLGKTNKFITTPIIKPNMYTEYFFSEAGDYTYWTIGYGIQGKIEVIN
ncbi:hypothetical protein HYX11_03105 [Candidatus Woesearchaeota archaeon]|nr:hypothetical protein [Candidatus Woesearchaeota archaeon]